MWTGKIRLRRTRRTLLQPTPDRSLWRLQNGRRKWSSPLPSTPSGVIRRTRCLGRPGTTGRTGRLGRVGPSPSGFTSGRQRKGSIKVLSDLTSPSSTRGSRFPGTVRVVCWQRTRVSRSSPRSLAPITGQTVYTVTLLLAPTSFSKKSPATSTNVLPSLRWRKG